MAPNAAAKAAVGRIIKKYPKAQVAIVVANRNGNFGIITLTVSLMKRLMSTKFRSRLY